LRLKIRCLSIVIVNLTFCAALYAADDALPLADDIIEPLSLHESRYWQDIHHIAEDVTILTREQIESLPANNISDVLQYVAGVNIDIGTGLGHPVAYSMRAAEGRHVRIMIDGIDFNNQVSGQSALAELPIDNVKQIEIIKGPVSSRWGSALGGIINIVTKDTGDSVVPQGSFTYVLSEYKQRRYKAEINGGVNNLSYYAFGEYAEVGGIRNFDDILVKNGFEKVSYTFNDFTISQSAGYIGNNESEGFYPDPVLRWSKQDYISRFGRVRLDYDPSERLHIHVTGRTNHQTIRSYDDFLDRSEFRDELWGLDFETVVGFREFDKLVVGIDADRNRLKTLNIPQSSSMHTEAFYVNYNFVKGPFTFVEGLRFDSHSEFHDEWSPSLGIVAEVPSIPETRVRATFSKGFNAPPLLWLFHDTAMVKSNRDLRPERAWVWQAGVETQPCDKLWLKANVFRSDVKDFITIEQMGATFSYRNNRKYRLLGAELEGRYTVCKGFDITAGGSINDVENTS